MYKLTFTLKQHTPIIHFQHDQDGATLRATEVKPKLDRFLIEKIQNEGKELPKDWLVGIAKNATLNYKMRIIASEEDIDSDVSGSIEKQYLDNKGNKRYEKFPGFFGLMGVENEGKKEFVHYKKIKIILTSFSLDLVKFMEIHIGHFFLLNNFGTRQSKGFGSFYPTDLNKYPITPLKYYFDIDVEKLTSLRFKYIMPISVQFRQQVRLFEVINLFYNTLRSGINQSWGQNPIYFKSMMFMYAKNQLKVQWDKKKIKEALFGLNLSDQKRKYPNSDIINFISPTSYLLRDLLGLATDSQWFGEYHDAIHYESLESEKIERFRSPLFFKPLEINSGTYRVYFYGNQSSLNAMLGKRFKISNNSGKYIEISTPQQFNIDEFLRYAMSIDIEKHISIRGGGYSPEKELLKNIYSQVRINAGISLRS